MNGIRIGRLHAFKLLGYLGSLLLAACSATGARTEGRDTREILLEAIEGLAGAAEEAGLAAAGVRAARISLASLESDKHYTEESLLGLYASLYEAVLEAQEEWNRSAEGTWNANRRTIAEEFPDRFFALTTELHAAAALERLADVCPDTSVEVAQWRGRVEVLAQERQEGGMTYEMWGVKVRSAVNEAVAFIEERLAQEEGDAASQVGRILVDLKGELKAARAQQLTNRENGRRKKQVQDTLRLKTVVGEHGDFPDPSELSGIIHL